MTIRVWIAQASGWGNAALLVLRACTVETLTTLPVGAIGMGTIRPGTRELEDP